MLPWFIDMNNDNWIFAIIMFFHQIVYSGNQLDICNYQGKQFSGNLGDCVGVMVCSKPSPLENE